MVSVTVVVTNYRRWKHAVACHRGSNVDGEGDFYIVDDVHKRLKELND